MDSISPNHPGLGVDSKHRTGRVVDQLGRDLRQQVSGFLKALADPFGQGVGLLRVDFSFLGIREGVEDRLRTLLRVLEFHPIVLAGIDRDLEIDRVAFADVLDQHHLGLPESGVLELVLHLQSDLLFEPVGELLPGLVLRGGRGRDFGIVDADELDRFDGQRQTEVGGDGEIHRVRLPLEIEEDIDLRVGISPLPQFAGDPPFAGLDARDGNHIAVLDLEPLLDPFAEYPVADLDMDLVDGRFQVEADHDIESGSGFGGLHLDPLGVGRGVHGQNPLAQEFPVDGSAHFKTEHLEDRRLIQLAVALHGEAGDGNPVDAGRSRRGGDRRQAGNGDGAHQGRTMAPAGGEKGHGAGPQ